MAARIIHFGWDNAYRVPVLRWAGFEVRVSRSLPELVIDLQRDEPVDAVLFSEDIEPNTDEAADLVRKSTRAPMILFRRTQRWIDESKFTKVYSGVISPQVWLDETSTLIAQSRGWGEPSAHLGADSRAAAAESINQVARVRRSCRRPGRPIPPAQ